MKNLFFVYFILFSLIASAQSNLEPKVAIQLLKDGALVVNLIHPQKKIEALIKSGQKQEAIDLQAEAEADHQSIILAFTNNYTFSKLLFVHSYDIGRVADGDATALFNTAGNAEAELPKNYFYVEFGLSPEKSLNGLIIKDAARDPLSKPFPYFVSKYEFLGINELSYSEMVMNLNKRLSAFYAKSVKK